MAQPTYEDGYRKGVEDATRPLPSYFCGTSEDMNSADEIPGFKSRSGKTTLQQINLHLEKTRKSLLTKKVTKWVNFYIGPLGNIQTGNKSVYDSREIAGLHTKFPDLGFEYLGTFPIEIEVPL